MTLDMQHKTTKIMDNELHYWTTGSLDKQAIILIHGFTGDHRGFYKIAPLLAKQYTVITLDLPGFGQSKIGNKTMSVELHTQTVAHLIKHLDCNQPPIVLGHSYGSLVVAELQATCPELTAEKTIFVSPVATPITLIDSRSVGRLFSQLYFFFGAYGGSLGMHLLKSHLLTKIITNHMLTTRDIELKKEIHSEHIENSKYIQQPKQNYGLFREINKNGIVKYAPDIPKKVLIISGNKDSQCPIKQQKKAVQAFRRATLVELDRAGHLSHYEEPESIAESIVNFLNHQ